MSRLAPVREALRRYFMAGLLVFAPIGVTIWAIAWIVQWLDNLLLPHALRLLLPGVEEPLHVPLLLGAVFTLLVVLLLGVIVRHLFGMRVVALWERLLARVPVARSIYGGVKQLLEAIFVSSARSSGFRRVVLIEYPRRGVYAIAFTTGPAQGVLQTVKPERMINCFVPTTPNPTSGFYLVVPEPDLIEVAISVEEAFKLVMSAGLVAPGSTAPEVGRQPKAVPAQSPSTP
jgi:uncharacterized membrane protein